MSEKAAGSLALELPWWGWVDETTCLTRSGELVVIGELSPVVVDGRTADELDAVTGRWQQMLSGLPEGIRVSWIVERRPAKFEAVAAKAEIAALAQRKRQAFLAERVQELRVYVVWIYDAGVAASGAGARQPVVAADCRGMAAKAQSATRVRVPRGGGRSGRQELPRSGRRVRRRGWRTGRRSGCWKRPRPRRCCTAWSTATSGSGCRE